MLQLAGFGLLLFPPIAAQAASPVVVSAPREASVPTPPMAARFENLAQGSSALSPEWWRAFGDPHLDELISVALERNLTIAEAGARLARARADVRLAEGAVKPALGVDASAGFVRLSEEDPQLGPATALPGFERDQDRYAIVAGASWEIDLFGRLGARSRAARADALASAAEVEAARLAITCELAERYVTLRLLQQRLRVAEARADALSRLAALAALRAERGVTAPIERDHLLAEARSASAAIPLLTAAIEEQLARLDVLLAREIGTSSRMLAPEQPIPAAFALDLALTPADLLARRPDVLAAEATLVARDATVAAALRDRLPRFNLAGLIGTIAGALNPLFGGAAFAAQGSAAIGYTALDGGRSRAAVDAARADVAGAANAYQRTVLSAIAEVETAAASRDSADIRFVELSEAEARLEAIYAAVQEGERQGALALSDLLDVDRRLQDARDARLEAEGARTLATIALVRALGGGVRANGGDKEPVSDRS